MFSTAFAFFKSTISQFKNYVYLGGLWNNLNNITTNAYLNLTNSTGYINNLYNTGSGGLNNFVQALSISGSGADLTLTAGGNFTTYTYSPAIVNTDFNGVINNSFNIGVGFDSSVYKVVQQSDGKLLVGGAFTKYKNTPVPYLVRLETNGNIDTSFNSGGAGPNNSIRSITIQSDGKILIGGQFTTYNGYSLERIIRLNSDGSIDSSFTVPVGANQTVFDIAIQSDNKILIGGSFTSFNGTSINRIARLNEDGSLDDSFNVGTGFNSGAVYKIKILSDGNYLIGGSFSNYNLKNSRYLVSLTPSGSLNPNFAINEPNNTVFSIASSSDNKIALGGSFSTLGNFSPNLICKLDSTGSVNESFYVNSGAGFNNTVRAFALGNDGKITVGGDFIQYNSFSTNRIAQLNSDGSRNSDFTGSGFNNTVSTLLPQSENKILAGGSFTTYNGYTQTYLAGINPDGSKNTYFFTTGSNSTVFTSTSQGINNSSYIGGAFTSLHTPGGSISTSRIARLNIFGLPDGLLNTTFNGTVRKVAVQSDGKIICVGDFTEYASNSCNHIIRLNPDKSIDSTFIIGTGFGISGTIQEVTLDSNGYIYVGLPSGGGSYNGTNLASTTSVLKLNPDGTINAEIDTSGYSIIKILFQTDGKMLVASSYVTSEWYGSQLNNLITRYNVDNSIDSSFSIGTGFEGGEFAPGVYADGLSNMVIQSDNKLVCIGTFGFYQSTSSRGIVRLNTDGTLDNSFVVGDGFYFPSNDPSTLKAIAIQTNGKILVGGLFYYYGNTVNNGIIRLNSDGSIDTSFTPGNGITVTSDTAYATSLAVSSDGSIFISVKTENGVNTPEYNYVTIPGSNSSGGIAKITSSGSLITPSFTPTTNPNIPGPEVYISSEKLYLYNSSIQTYQNLYSDNLVVTKPTFEIDGQFTSGFNNTVVGSVMQSDGKTLFAGLFTVFSGSTANYVARLNTNGTLDNTFSTSAGFTGGSVSCVAIQPNGKILVGGTFTAYRGSSTNAIRLVRLNADGTQDASFTIGAGFNNNVTSIRTFSDNSILVGGQFTTYSGSSQPYSVKLTPSGSIDTSYNRSTFNSVVYSLQASGSSTLIGGIFTTYNTGSNNISRIAKINISGSKDISFIPSLLTDTVNDVAFQNNETLILGGAFNFVGGKVKPGLLKLDNTGSLIEPFNSPLSVIGSINTLYTSSGSIFAGGSNTVNTSRLISLDYLGKPKVIYPVTLGITGGVVNTILEQSNKQIIGGTITTSSSGSYLVRTNSDGTLDSTFQTRGLNNAAWSINAQSDGKIVIGGSFTSYLNASGSSTQTSYLTRLNSDGSRDTSFISGSTTVMANSLIYSAVPSIISGSEYIYIGGNFTTYANSPTVRMARLNPNGTLDGTFGLALGAPYTGFNSIVYTIAPQSDGKLLVGGAFTTYRGVSYNRIIRLNTDGSVDGSFTVGAGFSAGSVLKIKIQTDGKILVGGDFINYQGSDVYRVIRLNSDGSKDSTYTASVQPNVPTYNTSYYVRDFITDL